MIRPRGRPKGSLDSYDREAARKERLEAHAAAMRERYGSVEELEREIYQPGESERDAGRRLADQVIENDKIRKRRR